MQGPNVGDLDRRHVFEGEHLAGGALPDDDGYAHPVVVGKGCREAFRADAFVQVVDLFEAGLGEFLDKRGHVDPVGDKFHMAEPPTHLAQGGQVDVDNRVDARALHLDDDPVEPRVGSIKRGQSGSVRLTERCRRHRRLVDRHKGSLERHAQLRFGCCANSSKSHGGDLILQPLEFFGDLGRQHVEARGHELPDLDHEATEVGRQHVKTLGEALHPFRTCALRDFHQPDAGQKQLEPPRYGQIPAGKTQNAAVAGAHVSCARVRIVATSTSQWHPVSPGRESSRACDVRRRAP